MSDANKTTMQAVERWRLAIVDYDRAKSALNRAECEVSNATNDLGKLLAPADLQEGETVGIWVRVDGKEELVMVRWGRHGDYEVTVRESRQPSASLKVRLARSRCNVGRT